MTTFSDENCYVTFSEVLRNIKRGEFSGGFPSKRSLIGISILSNAIQ